MSEAIERLLFSVADFYKLEAAGILGADERVELIDGKSSRWRRSADRMRGG